MVTFSVLLIRVPPRLIRHKQITFSLKPLYRWPLTHYRSSLFGFMYLYFKSYSYDLQVILGTTSQSGNIPPQADPSKADWPPSAVNWPKISQKNDCPSEVISGTFLVGWWGEGDKFYLNSPEFVSFKFNCLNTDVQAVSKIFMYFQIFNDAESLSLWREKNVFKIMVTISTYQLLIGKLKSVLRHARGRCCLQIGKTSSYSRMLMIWEPSCMRNANCEEGTIF